MRPLKITFFLKTPIALGHPWIHLDSLLAHVALLDELGEEYYSLPTKVAIAHLPKLKLGTFNDVYRASVSLIDGKAELPRGYVAQYFKRPEFPHGSGKIRVGSGFFKAYLLKAVYVPAKSVTFYAYGDPAWVREMASRVVALGKDTNIGFGFVKEVTVEEMEEDCSLICNGLAMRPIPVRYLRRYEDAAYLAYKPPYWDRNNVDLCAVPFTRVEL